MLAAYARRHSLALTGYVAWYATAMMGFRIPHLQMFGFGYSPHNTCRIIEFSPRTAKRPVFHGAAGRFSTIGVRRLSVWMGQKAINLSILFTRGGVLLELSVVHWQFSFVSGRESLLPRVSSPS